MGAAEDKDIFYFPMYRVLVSFMISSLLFLLVYIEAHYCRIINVERL